MRIVLVGTGISQGIPVVGCPCDACRSNDVHDKRLRTAAVVESGNTRIAIDIGPDFRYQMLSNGFTKLDAVIITHEHSDHIAGLDDIRPFNWTARSSIPFYAEQRVLDALAARFPYAFMPADKRYPGAPQITTCPIDANLTPFSINDLRVKPIRINHGKLPIVGYRIGSFAYITDCSSIPPESMNELKKLDLLVINALRHEPHKMHLSLSEALNEIARIAPQRAVLTHISHEMGPADTWDKLLPENVEAGYDGMELFASSTPAD